MDLGSNFLFILAQNNPGPLSSLGRDDAETPHALSVFDLLALVPNLHPGALEIIKKALAEGALVHFVKQLQFPPRPDFPGYLLYCGVRGIISRHDNVSEARAACLRQYQQLLLQGEFPEVGIYEWSKQAGAAHWVEVFTPSAEAGFNNEKPVQTSLEAVA